MAVTNYKIRHLTGASAWITVTAMLVLSLASVLILYYEVRHAPEAVALIVGIYAALTLSAWGYARWNCRHQT